jgi:hypothetical protein
MSGKTIGSIAALSVALGAIACGTTVASEDTASGKSPSAASIGIGNVIDATIDVSLCGRVDAYVAASVDADGALTIDGKPLKIKAGAHVEGEIMLVLHASVCLTVKLDLDGKATHVVVRAGDGASCTSCGGSSSGGSSSGGSSSGGASSGGASSGGSSSGGNIDLSADIDVCGVVSAFTAAGATSGGSLTIAGKTLNIASGVSLVGEALLLAGANVCVHAHVDASGALCAPSAVSLNLTGSARVHVCGTVQAYAAASATACGELSIGACGFRVAAGAAISGEARLSVGASVCIDAKLTSAGELTVCTVSAS